MKFRLDFVTNSSSTGYVAVKIGFKDGRVLDVNSKYDSGYGGYVWNHTSKKRLDKDFNI